MSGISGNYEGKQTHIRNLKTPDIEVFENIYPEKDYTIDFEIPEFTSICPKTGLPDFGTFYIRYIPDKVCIELKSLKEYFTSYRNVGIFHENVTNKVGEDLISACKPRFLKVSAVYNVRGGITTKVSYEYSNL